MSGENRASELEEKWSRWSKEFEFHFIGHLQRRKVPAVLCRVTLIHSVDSISLIEELDKRAESEVKVLLEVNVSGEESKYGILPEAASTLLQRAGAYRKVDFLGLMSMAPFSRHPETVRCVFSRPEKASRQTGGGVLPVGTTHRALHGYEQRL